jgi:hypothetical protein
MTLENLFKIKQLHQEPPDKREFIGLISAANDRLVDAQNSTLSYSSRFDLAYNAAHGYALAALRAKGYRTDKRYLVFQCLTHTMNIEKAKVRLFSICHERRNLAEYEGYMDVDEALLAELINNTNELAELVRELVF